MQTICYDAYMKTTTRNTNKKDETMNEIKIGSRVCYNDDCNEFNAIITGSGEKDGREVFECVICDDNWETTDDERWGYTNQFKLV